MNQEIDTEATVFIHGLHCPDCRGYGYTAGTATEVRKGRNGVYTHRQGSGCPKCLGTGLIGVSDKVVVDDEIRRLLTQGVTLNEGRA